MKRLGMLAGIAPLLIVLLGSNAWALTVMKGQEASDYLGDLKAHVLAGKYTYEILARSHRDAMHGRFSDALLFNTGGGNFLYPRRRDGDHIIVIDAPNGREEEPVTEDVWRQKIKNVVSDDNGVPYVFFDDTKHEIAILMVGTGTQVAYKVNDTGLLEISVHVESQGVIRGRRRGL